MSLQSPAISASSPILRYYHGAERLRYAGSWLVTIAATVVFGSAGILISFLDHRGRVTHACARLWAQTMLWINGIELEIEGLDELPSDTDFVFVANHHSVLDIPAMLAALPMRVRMLAKASLFRIPFLGWYMGRVGYVPVRSSSRAGARSFEKAVRRAGHGASMLVFPEGTRTSEGAIERFRKGGFYLARSARLPVVPVALINSGRLLPRGRLWADPGVIRVRVGSPLSAMEDESLQRLATRAGSAVSALARGYSAQGDDS